MFGDISKENIVADKQKSDTYTVIFNTSSGKFIPVKNAERLKRPGKTGSGATTGRRPVDNILSMITA